MASDYWLMGGYAAFIWPAYGLAAFALLAALLLSRKRLAKARKALAEHEEKLVFTR